MSRTAGGLVAVLALSGMPNPCLCDTRFPRVGRVARPGVGAVDPGQKSRVHLAAMSWRSHFSPGITVLPGLSADRNGSAPEDDVRNSAADAFLPASDRRRDARTG